MDPCFKEEDIIAYFNSLKIKTGESVNVVKVNFSYRLEEYDEQLEKVKELKKKVKALAVKETAVLKKNFEEGKALKKPEAASKDVAGKPKESAQEFILDEAQFSEAYKTTFKQFNEENQKLESLLGRMKNDPDKYRTGICFVTLRTKQMKEDLVRMMGSKAGFWRRLIYIDNKRTMSINGRSTPFTLKGAPDASDINWQNLGTTHCKMLMLRILTYTISLVLLGISFGLILLLKYAQKKIADELTASGQSIDFSSLGFRLLSVGITLIITIINLFISAAMTSLTKLEKFTTNTDYYRSLTIKITIVQFINTNLLILIAHVLLMYPRVPIYSSGAILSDAWFILIAQVAINPLINSLDPFVFLTCYRKSKLKKSIPAGQADSLTQEEAHAMVEFPHWDPAYCHSIMIKDFFTCLFFQPLFPISGGVGMIGAFLMYWSQKHKFLRYSNRPIILTAHVGMASLYLFSLAPLVYGVSFSLI